MMARPTVGRFTGRVGKKERKKKTRTGNPGRHAHTFERAQADGTGRGARGRGKEPVAADVSSTSASPPSANTLFLPLFLLATPASSDLPLTDAGATNLKAARQRSVDDHISGAWRAALRWPTCIFHPAAEIIRNS